MKKKKLLIRADASPRMGTGHVMRCLALALAARSCGWESFIAAHVESPWVAERLKYSNLPHEILPGPPPAWERPEDLERLLAAHDPAAVVLDGYHFGPDCQKHLLGRRPLLVIDDYAHLPEYHADVLLNQNAGSEALIYKGILGQKLLGPHYALLRPEFAAARQAAEKREFPTTPEKILVTLGGGDFIKILERLSAALSIPETAGKSIRILAGSMEVSLIQQLLQHSPTRLEILQAVTDMPQLLLDTDLCVTAGGSTCWELCCLGVPFLTVEVAANQRLIIETLIRSTAAPIFSRKNFAVDLAGAGHERRAILMKLVDGAGAGRVLEAFR